MPVALEVSFAVISMFACGADFVDPWLKTVEPIAAARMTVIATIRMTPITGDTASLFLNNFLRSICFSLLVKVTQTVYPPETFGNYYTQINYIQLTIYSFL